MKIIFFTSFLIISLYSKGQSVFADPAVSQISVSNLTNSNLNAHSISLGNTIKLKIPIYNRSILNGLPSGSCKIKIGLGSKLVMDPQFNYSSLPSSNYFDWTEESAGGQVQITGDLKTNLPSNFSDTIEFKVKGSMEGNSTVTTNFLVTNHNTTIILSDEVSNNNTSFLAYSVASAGPLPVIFTDMRVVNNECSIQVDLSIENEINVSKYEFEVSRDGTNFVKTGEIAANNLIHYNYSFAISDANRASVVFVRIKSLDKDGRFIYSGTKSVNGLCDKEWEVSVFPNPARAVKNVIINARQGLFNGRYVITLSDMAGKTLLVKKMNLVNTNQFNFETGNLSAALYIINIFNQNGGQSAVVKWQNY